MTAIVVGQFVRVITVVLPVRNPVPRMPRPTLVPASLPDISLDPLTETAFISIGRFPVACLPTLLTTVRTPLVLATQIRLGRLP